MTNSGRGAGRRVMVRLGATRIQRETWFPRPTPQARRRPQGACLQKRSGLRAKRIGASRMRWKIERAPAVTIALSTQAGNFTPFLNGDLSESCGSALIWRCDSFVNSGSGIRARHIRRRARRLKAVAGRVHSAATFGKLRNRNHRACCCSLMIPKTGSTSSFSVYRRV